MARSARISDTAESLAEGVYELGNGVAAAGRNQVRQAFHM